MNSGMGVFCGLDYGSPDGKGSTGREGDVSKGLMLPTVNVQCECGAIWTIPLPWYYFKLSDVRCECGGPIQSMMWGGMRDCFIKEDVDALKAALDKEK